MGSEMCIRDRSCLEMGKLASRMTRRAESVIANSRAESVIAKMDTCILLDTSFNRVCEIQHISASFHRLQEIERQGSQLQLPKKVYFGATWVPYPAL